MMGEHFGDKTLNSDISRLNKKAERLVANRIREQIEQALDKSIEGCVLENTGVAKDFLENEINKFLDDMKITQKVQPGSSVAVRMKTWKEIYPTFSRRTIARFGNWLVKKNVISRRYKLPFAPSWITVLFGYKLIPINLDLVVDNWFDEIRSETVEGSYHGDMVEAEIRHRVSHYDVMDQLEWRLVSPEGVMICDIIVRPVAPISSIGFTVKLNTQAESIK